MDLGLTDRVFIVGGGTAGLGLATASALVDEGARVLVAGRSPQRAADAVAHLDGIAGQTGTAHALTGDLTERESARQLVEAALAHFGRLDGALVNTGGPRVAPVPETTEDDWETAAAQTLLAPVRLARTVIEHLRGPEGDGGSIAFVLSGSVRSPLPRIALSNAIRPGLAMHVKDLADHYGPPPKSVRVTGLLPYKILSDRLRGHGLPDLETIPLRRVGQPEEFGRVATFLLSDAASYVTGSVVSVDGGGLRAV